MRFHFVWPAATIPQKIDENQIHVWAWPLYSAASRAHQIQREIALLDTQELDRLSRFHFDRDRLHFAITHANMRRILGAYLNVDPTSILFRSGPFGKPELAGNGKNQPLYFNLSHSRNIGLFAVSMNSDLGVDIEEIRPIGPAVAESHFSSVELAALATLQRDAWLLGFYNCWTRKEAILKAEGIGLSIPLDSFDVSLIPGEPARVLGARPTANFRRPWVLHSLSVATATTAALVTSDPLAQIRCFRLPDPDPRC